MQSRGSYELDYLFTKLLASWSCMQYAYDRTIHVNSYIGVPGMPYYAWHGVGLAGNTARGFLFASSPEALDLLLLERNIACIALRPATTLLTRSITRQTKTLFFERFAALLQAGILVPEAITIMRDAMGHIRMQCALEHITRDIHHGISLSDAMRQHPMIFNEHMIHMAVVGQETGMLPLTMQTLAAHLESEAAFRAKIINAITMPLVSLAFFAIVVLVVIISVLPTLANIMGSLNQEPPIITKALLRCGEFMKSLYGIGILSSCTALLYIGWLYVRKLQSIQTMVHTILIRLPIIGTTLTTSACATYCEALALLMRAGVQLVPALLIAEQSCANTALHKFLVPILPMVASGIPLSNALTRVDHAFFSVDNIGIIRVGEETGNIVTALEQIAKLSRIKAFRSINFMTKCMQPLMLLLLGILVMMLIISIYEPLLTISWTIA